MKLIHIIGILILAVAIGFILNQTKDYSEYSTFTKAKENAGKEFHIIGKLNKNKDVIYNPLQNSNYLEFYLLDEENVECRVIFKDAKPDGFGHAEKIVVAGKIENQNFIASQILMKCPSKYVNQKPT